MNFVRLILLAAALLLPSLSALAAEEVGKVTRMQGTAMRSSEGRTSALAVNAPIHMQDEVSTGEDARLQVTFADGTQVTVGERSRLKIDAFVYRPAGGSNQLALSIAGPFRFISGKMPKGPNTAMSVTTPVATIGVRGTNFWGGPSQGVLGILLFDGAIVVRNAAGQAVMSRPRTGVDVRGPGQAPGPVTQWGQARINQAVATVTFR